VGIALKAGGDHERLSARLASAKAGLGLIAGKPVSICVVIGFLLVITLRRLEQPTYQKNNTDKKTTINKLLMGLSPNASSRWNKSCELLRFCLLLFYHPEGIIYLKSFQ